MDQRDQYIHEPKISLGYLIKRFIFWTKFILSKWLFVGIGAVCIILAVLAWNYLKPQVFTAKTTFVLDKGSSEGLGDLGSLASLAGVNVGGLTEGSVLFQIDNIQELYRSRRMIEQTLLSEVNLFGERKLLIQRFAESNEFDKEWSDQGISLLDFERPRGSFTRAQDSVLRESVELINEEFLIVGKPNRKASILEVGFVNKDEALAKYFTELHVSNVNEFYIKTKTKKSAANLAILQHQADSVKRVLDNSILELAQIDENIPNPNPLYKTSQVPYQRAMISVQANSAIYQEIVKQLELAKVSHRNQLPLIQVIDKPRFPLEDNRWKLLKTLVLGSLLGVFIMISYIFIKQIILNSLNEDIS